MIGPALLHHDSNFQTYHSFFSHVKSITKYDITGTVLQPNIEIQLGSDDEKALVAAMDSVFPNSIRFLCTRHLKENVVRFLTKKVGVPQVDLKVMKSAIFGKDGLAHADSPLYTKSVWKHLKDVLRCKSIHFFKNISMNA